MAVCYTRCNYPVQMIANKTLPVSFRTWWMGTSVFVRRDSQVIIVRKISTSVPVSPVWTRASAVMMSTASSACACLVSLETCARWVKLCEHTPSSLTAFLWSDACFELALNLLANLPSSLSHHNRITFVTIWLAYIAPSDSLKPQTSFLYSWELLLSPRHTHNHNPRPKHGQVCSCHGITFNCCLFSF